MHKKRAITLAGGGPAAGLHIGALLRLERAGIDFDVWALSCIGAWVGIVYQTREECKSDRRRGRARQTYQFFKKYVFRDDASYEWFPVNRAFSPDIGGIVQAWSTFAFERQKDYTTLLQPAEIFASALRTFSYAFDPIRWGKPSEFNYWLLNDLFAVHPVSRYLTSLMYLSRVNGLSRIYYAQSAVLEQIDIKKLNRKGAPEIYHNAWRLKKGGGGEMQIFHNMPSRHAGKSKGHAASNQSDYKHISVASLCACSALPYIEETVEIDGETYCEGALVDTVNFKDLLRDHDDLSEVWVSRIVDTAQVKAPKNLADGLANLAMLFAAELGENDIKLFRQHLMNRRSVTPRIVEIPISPETKVTFDWKHSNLLTGVREGYRAVDRLLKLDKTLRP